MEYKLLGGSEVMRVDCGVHVRITCIHIYVTLSPFL